jgi:hypothetical protein
MSGSTPRQAARWRQAGIFVSFASISATLSGTTGTGVPRVPVRSLVERKVNCLAQTVVRKSGPARSRATGASRRHRRSNGRRGGPGPVVSCTDPRPRSGCWTPRRGVSMAGPPARSIRGTTVRRSRSRPGGISSPEGDACTAGRPIGRLRVHASQQLMPPDQTCVRFLTLIDVDRAGRPAHAGRSATPAAPGPALVPAAGHPPPPPRDDWRIGNRGRGR